MRFGHALRAGLAVVATLLAAGSGRAADVTIRFSTAAPPSDFLARSLAAFKAEVEAAAIGVKVETHPASTLFRQGTEVPLFVATMLAVLIVVTLCPDLVVALPRLLGYATG